MKFLAISLCLLIITGSKTPDKEFADHEKEFESKYEPDIVDDFKNVDYQVSQQWQQLYETVMAGYGYLKMECEDELKRAVKWVEDYYENVTSEYEQALYDLEQTYISMSEEPDYQFLYDIEEIVYDGLDELEEAVLDAEQDLEEDYWVVVAALDKAQDDVENILEISESRVDDIMDDTESELESYTGSLNAEKWTVQEVEQETSEDIDDDIVDYYEDDEEDFNNAELAAINELKNDLTDVADFDTAPSYQEEYEQKHGTVEELKEDIDDESSNISNQIEGDEKNISAKFSLIQRDNDIKEEDHSEQIKGSALIQKNNISYLKGSDSIQEQVLIQTSSPESSGKYVGMLTLLAIGVHALAVCIVYQLAESEDEKQKLEEGENNDAGINESYQKYNQEVVKSAKEAKSAKEQKDAQSEQLQRPQEEKNLVDDQEYAQEVQEQ